jgi:predicted  nucleic acid-binding Zn-ribbon protein
MGIKLYITGGLVAALVVVGLVGNTWRVQVSALKSQVKMYEDATKQCEADLEGANVSIGELRGAVDSANFEIGVMQERADDLAARLSAATIKIATDRVAYERRLAELSKPLPSDCQEAVREVARRLGAP